MGHRTLSDVIKQLDVCLAEYCTTFYRLHGTAPKEQFLANILKASVDSFEDARIRAILRRGVYRIKVDMDNTDCNIRISVTRKSLSRLSKYLSNVD